MKSSMAQDHLYGWMLHRGAISGRDGLDGIRMGRRRMTRYCKMSNLLWEDSLQTFFFNIQRPITQQFIRLYMCHDDDGRAFFRNNFKLEEEVDKEVTKLVIFRGIPVKKNHPVSRSDFS